MLPLWEQEVFCFDYSKKTQNDWKHALGPVIMRADYGAKHK